MQAPKDIPRTMKKFQIDLISILLLALIVAGAILIGGEYAGIKTPEARSISLSAVAICALILALLASLDRFGRWSDAVRSLGKWLHIRSPQMAGTTQAALLPQGKAVKPPFEALCGLREHLRAENGIRWRYRQSWLLLTGDEATVTLTLPDLVRDGWLAVQDAVLLWSKVDVDGRPDELWLKQLYKLRLGRPIDAVVLTLDGTADLSAHGRGAHAHSVNLTRIANLLHWSAPVYVLDIAQTDALNNGRTALIGCEFPPDANERVVESTLLALRSQIGHTAIGQLIRNDKDRYSAKLSQRLDSRSAPLAALIASLANRKRRHQSVSAAFFAPLPVPSDSNAVVDPNAPSAADLPLWTHLASIARKARGRRMGWHPMTVFSTIALSVLGLWTAGMLISGITNGRDLVQARNAAQTLKAASDPAARLQALLALQQQIVRYEERAAHQPPLWSRFGLNQDASILAALWPPYADASKSVLVTPIQQNLEATLVDLSQMPTDALDDHANAAAQDGHKALKTYLMLADPSRVDAGFITPQLTRYWSTNANVSVGAKLDISERLAGFYAQHLKAHDAWRIQPRAELVNASRQTLLSVIGVRNSEDTVYQSVLAGVGNKYPDQTLASLTAGTDTRGLIRTSVSVPGVYTRQAYEGYVAAAITEAAKSRDITRDWVLANNGSTGAPDATQSPSAPSSDALELALTTQYFNDYASTGNRS